MAGALGTLGVMTEISLQGAAAARAPRRRCVFEMDEAEAIARANAWAGQPLPLSATAWQRRRAARAPVRRARRGRHGARAKLGRRPRMPRATTGASCASSALAFFAGAAPLWRLSVPQTTAPVLAALRAAHRMGRRRCAGSRGAADALEIRSSAERAGGHATLFRGGDTSVGVFHPLQPAVMKIHQRLKAAFDPAGILNPGRMYDF